MLPKQNTWCFKRKGTDPLKASLRIEENRQKFCIQPKLSHRLQEVLKTITIIRGTELCTFLQVQKHVF